MLQVTAPSSDDGDGLIFPGEAPEERFTDTRPTVAQIVASIEALPQNDDLIVTYHPGSAPPVAPEASTRSSKAAVTVTSHSDWVTKGSVSVATGRIALQVIPGTTDYNGAVLLGGMVASAHGASNVAIYQRPAGAASFQLVTTVPVTASHGIGMFHCVVPKLTRNTTFKAAWDGDAKSLGATSIRTARVRAHLTLTAQPAHVQPGGHVELSATLEPLQPGVKVRFDRLVGGQWIPIKSVLVTPSGVASTTWSPPSGTSVVRAHFSGSSMNAPTNSAQVIVKSN